MAQFASGPHQALQDPPLRGLVETGFADCIAVLVAGWPSPAARIVREATARWRERIEDRALVIATAAHALDYDDTAFGAHPSAILVPALLAASCERPISGAEAIAAYLVGYEIWADLTARDRDPLHGKGWHPSAVFGAVAAAAAAGRALDLDTDQLANALNIAASMSGGVTANFGSMMKPVQLGRAAQSGLLAVRLSRLGLRAGEDALGAADGLLAALSPHGNCDTATAPALTRLPYVRRHGLNIKLWPACYAAHRLIDAGVQLHARYGPLDPDAVVRIEAELGATQSAVLRHRRPDKAEQAKFSAEFCIASALRAGDCAPDRFSDAFVESAPIQALMERTVRRLTTEQDPEEPTHAPFDRLTVVMKDGSRRTSDAIRVPTGHCTRPAEPKRLRAKFQHCVEPVLGAAGASALQARVDALATCGDIREILPITELEKQA
ncbi:MAG TPA: MmgE/PrpD family protein [Sphingomonadaceae bacterium]|nr:MmgE/PrpD family protein [Sphingomonadaceae bacterium]